MDQNHLGNIRSQYTRSRLDYESLKDEPVELIRNWLDDAINAGEPEPTAMCLATVSDTMPSARIVLLKEVRSEGLVFYTNYLSRKGRELSENGNAAAVLLWPLLERQLRVEGKVEKISVSESRLYFKNRPWSSQISASISPQSQVIPNDREWLEHRYNEMEKNNQTHEIEMPSHWGGFLMKFERVEFWQGRPDRLHDRFIYNYNHSSGQWEISRLAP